MKVCSVLLVFGLGCCCSAAGDHHDNPPAAMTLGTAQSHDPSSPKVDTSSPRLMELVHDQQQEEEREVLNLLRQLVLVQNEAAKAQAQVVQLLRMLGTQGSQQIQELQSVARHQSLLVENHQALLLQTSRIATQLQEITKKPPAAPPVVDPGH